MTNSGSLHTNDLLFDANPGDATRMLEEFILNTQGGTDAHQYGPSQAISSGSQKSIGSKVNGSSSSSLLDVQNHPNFIQANKTALDFMSFLESKGMK